MAGITFLQLAERIINEKKIPLSPVEIWQYAKQQGHDKLIDSKGKTPWQTIGAQIYVDMRDNPKTKFIKVDTTPRRFFLTNLSLDGVPTPREDIITGSPKQNKFAFLEKDLHPFLTYYGFNFLRIYLKTIRSNKSGKKEFGEWVHPDMVGCYFPFIDWENEVVEFGSVTGNLAIKLYSFEIKRELGFANLREAFFQAVSNSSWANEGYLVAAEISSDEDFLSELKRLSVSFGIGIIHINIDDPDSSEIIYPAHPKENLDWDMINKLAVMNSDFKEFIQRIKTDISSREIRKEKYDKAFEKQDLLALIKKL